VHEQEGQKYQSPNSRGRYRSSKKRGHMEVDISLCRIARTRRIKSRKDRTPEVNLDRRKQEDIWRKISHFRGLREQEEEKGLKPRTLEVKLGRPNQEATCHQISHFRNLTLQIIVRERRRKILEVIESLYLCSRK
jgi:hypothetical protein